MAYKKPEGVDDEYIAPEGEFIINGVDCMGDSFNEGRRDTFNEAKQFAEELYEKRGEWASYTIYNDQGEILLDLPQKPFKP